jgi:hypothetical protein
MSDTAHEWALVQERDNYSRRPALLTAFFTMLVILGVMILCAALLEGTARNLRATSRALTAASAVAPREIGGVKQTLIDVDDYGRRLMADQRRSLEGYHWTDRQAGRVDVPIAEGMRLVIERGGK